MIGRLLLRASPICTHLMNHDTLRGLPASPKNFLRNISTVTNTLTKTTGKHITKPLDKKSSTNLKIKASTNLMCLWPHKAKLDQKYDKIAIKNLREGARN